MLRNSNNIKSSDITYFIHMNHVSIRVFRNKINLNFFNFVIKFRFKFIFLITYPDCHFLKYQPLPSTADSKRDSHGMNISSSKY